MAPTPLSIDQISRLSAELPEWRVENGKLHREFRFADFNAAFGFMTRVALVAETLGHHPEWRNVWSTVTIDLITHDAGGLTELDVRLAQRIDQLLAS